MKQLLVLVAMLAFTACSGRVDDHIFIWDESMENPFYGETLAIAATGRDPMGRLASLYMSKNPGVNIEVIDKGFEIDHIREQVRVQLMAGQGPMLLESRFVSLHGRRDFFVDWMPLIEAHPGFTDETWRMDVFYALASDGQLFAFPESVAFSTYSANQNVPGLSEAFASMDSISARGMIDIYNNFGGIDSGLSMNQVFSVGMHMLLFSREFVDFENGFVNFLNPDYIAMLEETSQAMKRLPASVIYEMERGGDWLLLMAEYFMFHVNMSPYRLVASDIFYGYSGFENPVTLVDDSGKLVIFPLEQWVLSAKSSAAQRALALDFIRFTQDFTNADVVQIHETSQTVRHFNTLNRSRFEHSIERFLDDSIIFRSFEDRHLRKSRDVALDYVIQYVNHAMSRPMIGVQFVPDRILTFFRETLDSLNLGLISPHEAATMLQNRVTLEILEGN